MRSLRACERIERHLGAAPPGRFGELPEGLRVDTDRKDPEPDLAAVDEDVVLRASRCPEFAAPTMAKWLRIGERVKSDEIRAEHPLEDLARATAGCAAPPTPGRGCVGRSRSSRRGARWRSMRGNQRELVVVDPDHVSGAATRAATASANFSLTRLVHLPLLRIEGDAIERSSETAARARRSRNRRSRDSPLGTGGGPARREALRGARRVCGAAPRSMRGHVSRPPDPETARLLMGPAQACREPAAACLPDGDFACSTLHRDR